MDSIAFNFRIYYHITITCQIKPCYSKGIGIVFAVQSVKKIPLGSSGETCPPLCVSFDTGCLYFSTSQTAVIVLNVIKICVPVVWQIHMRLLYKTGAMESLRKWFYKPKVSHNNDKYYPGVVFVVRINGNHPETLPMYWEMFTSCFLFSNNR